MNLGVSIQPFQKVVSCEGTTVCSGVRASLEAPDVALS